MSKPKVREVFGAVIDSRNVKVRPCLRCDKIIRTDTYIRLCEACHCFMAYENHYTADDWNGKPIHTGLIKRKNNHD